MLSRSLPRRRPLATLAVAAVVAMTAACGPDADPAEGSSAASGSSSGEIGTAEVAPPAELPQPVEPEMQAEALAPPPPPAPPVPPAPPAPTAQPATAGVALDGYPFGPSSVWLADISTAPVDPNSVAMARHLAGTVSDRYGGVAALNAHQYNVSYFVAPPGTPRVDVAFNDCQGKGYLPQGLTGPGGQFDDVPIPAGAVGATGTDKAMAVYSPETDQLWEFWVAEQAGDGQWSACWGGRIDDASRGDGFFLNGFGASASGLAISGGMVRLADARAGSIDHALTLAIPEVSSDGHSWPAQRSDGGSSHPDAIREGTRLRLDPSIDVDALGLHPLAAMIAKAAQRHGFIVTDQSGAVAVSTESGVVEEAATGVDPWAEILGGTPDYLVMQHFPWDQLQALPRDFGRP